MRDECAQRHACTLRLQQAADQLMAGQLFAAYGIALEVLHDAGGCSDCDAAAACWTKARALAKGAMRLAHGDPAAVSP